MENTIESEPRARLSPINSLFWGLLIIFINIKIGDFDIFNDMIGLLIVIYGLYQLVNVSRMFRFGLYAALSSLALQIFTTVFTFSPYSKQPAFYIPCFLVGLTITMFMTYFILSGLAQLAESQQLYQLSSRLKSSFKVYLFSLIITVASLFFTAFALIFMVLCCILYIYLLAQIRTAYKSIYDIRLEQDQSPKIRPIKKFATVLLVCFLPLSLGVGIIAATEYHSVRTAPFIQNDLSDKTNASAEIRAKMVDLGFASDVVKTMPDSEISNFAGITNVQKCDSQQFSCDGGLLQLTQYVSGFGTQDYRYTVYYQWLKKPTLAHSEAVGIMLFNKGVTFFEQNKFSSLNLYDAENKTYSSENIGTNESIANSVMKFKLINKRDGKNYRGYLSFNAKISNQPWAFNNVFYYIHQSTIFNNKAMDILNFNDNKDSFTTDSEHCLLKEYNVMAAVDE